jgi:hypothetical protein
LEYLDNIEIKDSEPKIYYNKIKKEYYAGKERELEKSLLKHAIPKNFYEMNYEEFLRNRRKMIAKLIKKLYKKI